MFSDLVSVAISLAAMGVALANTLTRPGQERSFWGLTTLGFALWACNHAAGAMYDIELPQPMLNPSFFDIVLFFRTVPMIAAVVWRPDLAKREGRTYLSVRNFLILLGWWTFLYAFVVFPHQYVVLDVNLYNDLYERLYLLENLVLLVVLTLAARTSAGGWRRLYLHFAAADLLFSVGSFLSGRAALKDLYYSGSPYDITLIGSMAWMVAAMLSARDGNLGTGEISLDPRWKNVSPRLVSLALLSLPLLGVWAVLFDPSPPNSRMFRVATVLVAMLVLGTFVFLRQYLQDQALMKLLRESRQSYDSQKRLQGELVQKEKLATLGNLVAGAARDIHHPLSAVMNYSEELWTKERLTDEQNALVRKIVTQAGRTRDLVSDLLSFAQQSSAEKRPIDVIILLQRAKQLLESRRPSPNIRVSLTVEPDFPRVRCNTNQLFQAFVELIENATDALDESGGGSLEITAKRQGNEVVFQFSDSGPGIREPQRVFDPFYTTKPVGKGTGLGLSAVYGVIQDHDGQITCQNKREGGALFEIRLPAEVEVIVKSAGAHGG